MTQQSWWLWLLQLVPALILLQTLFFKFTAAPESVELFTQLGVEPWGRILLGVIELIAALLLIIPSTSAIGALLAAGLMIGAIGTHLFVIGIVSNNDGGLLFSLAVLTFICSVIVLYLKRAHLPVIGSFLG